MLQTADRRTPRLTSTAWVRLKLYKGNVIVTGRDSKTDESLFDATIATFEDDGGAYNQADAAASSSSMHCACVLRPTNSLTKVRRRCKSRKVL
jgi:argininosuccinate synthase